MKICFLSTLFPYRGGIAQFNADLYRAFEAKGHDVSGVNFTRQYPDFLFPGKSQYVPESDNADAIENVRLLDSINPFSWIKTARYLRKNPPDLLITRFWMPFFGPSLGYVSGKLAGRSKRIAILDNVVPHEKRIIDKPFTRYFLKRADAFVVMSRSVEKDLLKFKPDAKYIFHRHPLYDHFGKAVDKFEAREKLGINKDKKTLLFFGFIRKYKGLDILLEAFAKLDDSFQLVIAGDCYGSFEPYQEQIDNNPNKKRIHTFVRYIGDEEVPLFFSAADACVLPYRSATQSGITSISLHFELPVIATDVGGLKELIADNDTGKVIPEVNSEALVQGIHDFLHDNTDSGYRENIRKLKAEMSWENLADNILELSEKI
ncbi:MAG: glycosyltransferase [Bacteroidota bacterium]